MARKKKKPKKSKLQHQKMMVSMFRTPAQYINWIMNSGTTVGPDIKGQRKLEESVICNVMASVMLKALRECPKIEKHFDLKPDPSLRQAVRDMLEKENDHEYRFRMFLRHLGVRGALEMIVGYPHNIDKNSAIVRFNQHLIIEERAILLRHMRPCMDRDCVSPIKISQWLCPAITAALYRVHRKIIRGYGVRCLVMPGKEGLSAVLTCKSRTSDDIFTNKITIDFAILMKHLPKNFELQHPFPKSHPFPKKGREMIRSIKMSFEQGNSEVCLTAPLVNKMPVPKWYTDGSLLNMTKRERTKKMLSVGDLPVQPMEASTLETLAVISGSKPLKDVLWTIDYDIIEKIIQNQVKSQPSFRKIKEAFRLYHILSTRGKKVVPVLNEKTKRALELWIYKDKGDVDNDLIGVFTAVLHAVNNCITTNFCPSFCQPTINTMDSLVPNFDENSEDDDLPTEEEPNLIVELVKLLEQGSTKELIDFLQIM